ncbi:MAG: hypothetical protein LAO22_20240 [Acidobacteriia bacterium]|nr:hypothetical protein [Terriglobia bacterium]
MRRARSKRISLILVATLVAVSVNVAAQAPQNESIWQKIKKSAKQTGQNAAQQGSQQAQQVQQQVQQQIPVIGGQPNQMNANPQLPCGNVPNGAAGATLNNAAYTTPGGGAVAGSCGPQCFNAGPFAAAVTQMTMSQQGYWHIVRMNLQFQNLTNEPLIIAYRDGSMVMVDNLGNTYQAAGGNPGAVQGMGIDRGNQTDSQFVLGPGQTGNVMYSVARSRGNDSAIGTGFSYNFTIDELQAQNGAQAIAVRQYNLNFPSLTPGASGTALPGQGVAPASSIAGGKKSAASGVSSYVGGNAAPGIANPGVPAQVGRGALVGGPAAPVPAAVPAQPGVVNRATQNSRVPVAAAQNAVNNAALRSNAVAAKAVPAPAAKPIPASTTARKTATKPTDPAAKK